MEVAIWPKVTGEEFNSVGIGSSAKIESEVVTRFEPLQSSPSGGAAARKRECYANSFPASIHAWLGNLFVLFFFSPLHPRRDPRLRKGLKKPVFFAVMSFVGIVAMVLPAVNAATLTAFPPVSQGVGLATLRTLTALPDPSSLPDDERARTLDPWATDPARYGLPLGMSGVPSFAGWVNASVGGAVCKGLLGVEGWKPDGNGSVGMVCEGLREGKSAEVVGAEVALRLMDGRIVVVGNEAMARYDNLLAPVATETLQYTFDFTPWSCARLSDSKIAFGDQGENMVHILGYDQDTNQFFPHSVVGSGQNGGPTLAGGDTFGGAVEWIGDPNEDGQPELAVGAHNSKTVYILSFTPDWLTVHSFVDIRPGVAGFFGISIAWIGDVDGDGVANDMAIGAHGNSPSVQIVSLGRDLSVTRRVSISAGVGGGPSSTDYGFGVSMGFLGDLDGDGLAYDIVVGSWEDDTGGNNRGCVFVMTLGEDGAAKRLTKVAHGLNGGPSLSNGDGFGRTVSVVGDMDGDGAAAVVAVGSIASVYLVKFLPDGSSSRTLVLSPVTGTICLEWLFDLDGNGLASNLFSHHSGQSSSFSIADSTDAGTLPTIEGATIAFASLDNLSPTMSLIPTSSPPFALPQLDPQATDPTRRMLALSVLTNTFNASFALSVVSVSIGGRLCSSALLYKSWPGSANSRRVGVVCEGVPEGMSEDVVGAEVCWGEGECVRGENVARCSRSPLNASVFQYWDDIDVVVDCNGCNGKSLWLLWDSKDIRAAGGSSTLPGLIGSSPIPVDRVMRVDVASFNMTDGEVEGNSRIWRFEAGVWRLWMESVRAVTCDELNRRPECPSGNSSVNSLALRFDTNVFDVWVEDEEGMTTMQLWVTWGDKETIGTLSSPQLITLDATYRSRTTYLEIAAGLDHACARLERGEVRCWGNGERGALGTGSTENIGDDEYAEEGELVELGGRRAVGVAAGDHFSCAWLDSDEVVCWGAADDGQMGRVEEGGDVMVPGEAVEGLEGVVGICAGGKGVGVVLGNGSLVVWGGEFGGVGVVVEEGVVECAMGDGWGCGRKEDGGVVCGGKEGSWLGHEGGEWEEVGIGGEAVQVAAGWHHAGVVLRNGRVEMWGEGEWGELGVVEVNTTVPVEVDVNGSSVVWLSLGKQHSCILHFEEGLWDFPTMCFGDGSSGQLDSASRDNSNGSTAMEFWSTAKYRFDPTLLGGVTRLSSGRSFQFALSGSGYSLYWGSGIGAIVDSQSPLSRSASCRCSHSVISSCFDGGWIPSRIGKVTESSFFKGNDPMTAIAAGNGFSCGLRWDGSVHCWGLASRTGGAGAIGDDEPAVEGVAVPLPLPAIAIGGGEKGCAVLQDATTWCWDRIVYKLDAPAAIAVDNGASGSRVCTLGPYGDLFDNGDKVYIDGKAVQVAGNKDTCCALLRNGTVACSLGDNRFPSSKVVSAIAMMTTTSCAIEKDSRLVFCPGSTFNDALQEMGPAISLDVGNRQVCIITPRDTIRCLEFSGSFGNQAGYSHRQDISLGERVKSIACGTGHTCALLIDGVVRCWGDNSDGQAGIGNVDVIPEPLLVDPSWPGGNGALLSTLDLRVFDMGVSTILPSVFVGTRAIPVISLDITRTHVKYWPASIFDGNKKLQILPVAIRPNSLLHPAAIDADDCQTGFQKSQNSTKCPFTLVSFGGILFCTLDPDVIGSIPFLQIDDNRFASDFGPVSISGTFDWVLMLGSSSFQASIGISPCFNLSFTSSLASCESTTHIAGTTLLSIWSSVAKATGHFTFAGPQITSVEPRHLSSAKSTTLSVSGVGLGEYVNHGLTLRIGSLFCTSIVAEGPDDVSCIAPPFYGNHFIFAGISDFAAVGPILTSERPILHEVNPSSLLPSSTHSNLTICGSNLGGLVAGVPFNLTIGGVRCRNPTPLDSSTLLCTNFRSPPRWSSNIVTLTTPTTSTSSPILDPQLPPTLFSISAPSFPTLGASTATLRGSSLGLSQSDISHVLISNNTIAPATWISSSSWSFVLPPGVGSSSVRAVLSTGLASNPSTFAYSPPVVFNVTPAADLAGPGLRSYLICGENFGFDSVGMRAWVGGMECVDVAVETAGVCVRCSGVDVSRGWNAPDDPARIEVVSQRSPLVFPSVFTTHPLPAIASAFPSVVGPGESVVLSGTGFGLSASDISSVTVAGVACGKVLWSGSSTVSCTLPTNHPLWLDPTKLAATSSINVTLRTRVGAEAITQVVPRGQEKIDIRGPSDAPTSVWGWREPGAFERLHIAWLHTRNPTSYLDTPTSFLVTAIPVVDDNTLSSSKSVTVADADAVASTISSYTTSSIHRPYSTILPVSRHTPYNISVVAVNAEGGRSEEGLVRFLIPEECAEGSFLFTSTPESPLSIRCIPCPLGARCDAHSTSAEVFRDSGVYRLPSSWIPHGLGLARCLHPSSCPGDTSSLPDAPAEQYAFTRTNPPLWNLSTTIAIPQPVKDQCAEGHRGMLCEQCSSGYFKDRSGPCIRCPDSGLVAFGILVVIVCTCVSTTLFLLKKIAPAQSDFKEGTDALMITYHQVQRVSIIGTVIALQWPSAVQSLFDSSDSASMFGTGGVGFMECALGENAQNVLLKAFLVAFVIPISLLTYSALLWWAWPWVCVPLRHRWSRFWGAGSGEGATNEDIMTQRRTALWRSAPLTTSPTTGPHRSSPLSIDEHPSAMRNRYDEWRHWRTRFQVSTLVIAVMVHASVTRSGLQLLACFFIRPLSIPSPVPGTPSDYESSRLLENTDIECSGATWTELLSLGIPITILGGGGIPVALGLITLYVRSTRQNASFRELWGFATEAYRPEAFLWESVILLFKVALVSATVLLTRAGPVAQFSAAMVVESVFVMTHSWWKPYKRDLMNQLESGAHFVTAVSMAMGLYLAASSGVDTNEDLQTNAQTQVAVSVIVILVNVTFVVIGIILAYQRLQDPVCDQGRFILETISRCCKKKRANDEHFAPPKVRLQTSPHLPPKVSRTTDRVFAENPLRVTASDRSIVA